MRVSASLERVGKTPGQRDHGAVRYRHGFAGRPCCITLARPGRTLASGSLILLALADTHNTSIISTEQYLYPTISSEFVSR